MTSPLSGSLARTIGSAMRSLFLDATLLRDVPAVATEAFDPPAPTEAIYTCKAIVEGYAERFRLDGTVSAGDRKVLILATSLSVTPAAGDRVMIRGITFTIIEVGTDPAQAVWECKGRM
jgi:hypothetical protein